MMGRWVSLARHQGRVSHGLTWTSAIAIRLSDIGW